MKPKRAEGTLRIIGGEWRSRLVRFDADPKTGLRATPDRVRQTVFDWLAPVIPGAHCLDLFAGSGALGLEALSRGAATCRFADLSPQPVRDVRAAAAQLGAGDRAEVLHADALGLLGGGGSARHGGITLPADSVDVAFLDPPFGSQLLAAALALLPRVLRRSPATRVYLEWQGEPPALPAGLRWLKEKQAGAVSYGLLVLAPEAFADSSDGKPTGAAAAGSEPAATTPSERNAPPD